MKKIQHNTKRTTRLHGILALLLILPALTTGCQDFRNSAVDAIDAATRGLLLGNTSREAAIESAAYGIMNAALDVLFNQLRAETTR